MIRALKLICSVLLLASSCAAQYTPQAGHSGLWSPSTFGIALMGGNAEQGLTFSGTLTAVGATTSCGPITWSIIIGSPTQNGLTLAVGSTATITGTPTGNATWTVKWVDCSGRAVQGPVTLTPGTISTINVLPTNANVNQSQTQQFQAIGVFSDSNTFNITSTVTWSCSTGTGCTGSTVSATGLFTAGSTAGAATVKALFPSTSVSGTAAVTVVGVSNPISIQNNDPLSNGQQYQTYPDSTGNGSQGVGAGVAIIVTGGTPPYTCSVSSGSLPTGLSLANFGSSVNCLIVGTPTTSGAGSSFTVQVSDSASNSNTKVFASGITVASLSSLVVNLAQSSISANAGTTATAVGTYSDSSTANLPAAGGPQIVAISHANAGAGTSKQLSPTATTTGWFAFAITESWNTSACSATTMAMTSPNETFTSVAAAVGQAGAPPPYVNCVQAFYAANIMGANDAPTCTFTVADGGSCFVMYVTGMPTSSVLDQAPAGATSTSGTATSCVPNSLTTTQANELIVHVCFPNSASSFTPPTGFTATFTAGSPDNAYQVDTQIANSIQTGIAPAASFSPAGNEVALLSSFKANAPAPGGVVWSSSNTTCAFAYPLGHIAGQSVNTQCTATITGTVGAVSNTATITVTPSNGDTGIVVSPANPSIALNSTQQFAANGNVTNQQYTAAWGSSNTTIATINSSSGLATCLASGTANISAAVSGFTSASTTLTCTSGGGGSGRVFYIDHAAGNNANTGTKASPWQSAPVMKQNATCNSNNNVAPTYTHQTGDQFIFKGGVTWPGACLQIVISAGGTSQSTVSGFNQAPTLNGADYYGVDTTWFTGASFTRPIFDPGGGGVSGNTFAIIAVTANYVTIDDIEIAHTLASNGCGSGTIAVTGAVGVTVNRMFIHDWTVNGGITQSDHYTASICGDATASPSLNVYNTEVSDAAQPSGSQTGTCAIQVNEAAWLNCHNVSEGALFTQGNFHDNLIHDLDGNIVYANNAFGAHANGYESSFGGFPPSFYNNYMYNLNVGFNQICPGTAFFNNVISNVANAAISVDDNCGGVTSSTQTYMYNNTLDPTGSFSVGGASVRIVLRSTGVTSTGVVHISNNLDFNGIDTSGATQTPVIGVNYTIGASEAAAHGITPTNKYAPSSVDANVSGAGTNLCPCSGALIALGQDASGAWWFGGISQTRQPPPTPWSLGAYKNP